MNQGTLLKGKLFFVGAFAMLLTACGDSGGGKEALTPEEVGVDTIEDLPNCSKAREGDSVLVEEDSLSYVCRGGKWTPAESADDDSTKTGPASSSVADSLQESLAGGVQTMDDLPNCSKNREGDSVLVVEDSLTYICRSGKWEEKKYLIDSVKTEDDLPACTKGHEGDSAYVSGEYAVYVCSENVWKKDQSIVQVYKSADDMPNCTKKLADVEAISTVDSLLYQCDGERWQEMATTYASAEKLPNCTENREGNQAFLLDTREKFQCAGKQWKTVEEWSAAPGSSTSSSPVEYGTLTDTRDGQTYKTVTIGTQTWMAQNLNYDDGYGVCPMKEAENCEKYGRLYNLNGRGIYWNYDEDSSRVYSSNICPAGWRLPDSLDYAELIAYVSKNNGGEPVGVSLKATTGWISEGETVIIEGGSGSLDSTRVGASRGTDRFGFAALPAGSCWDERCYVGDDTRFFFSTPRVGGSYKLAFDKDSLIYDKDGGYGYISVRCLKGEASSSTVSSTSSSSNESSSVAAVCTQLTPVGDTLSNISTSVVKKFEINFAGGATAHATISFKDETGYLVAASGVSFKEITSYDDEINSRGMFAPPAAPVCLEKFTTGNDSMNEIEMRENTRWYMAITPDGNFPINPVRLEASGTEGRMFLTYYKKTN